MNTPNDSDKPAEPMTRAEHAARIAQMIGRNVTPAGAKRIADRERKLRSTRHKLAMLRRIECADRRLAATGKVGGL